MPTNQITELDSSLSKLPRSGGSQYSPEHTEHFPLETDVTVSLDCYAISLILVRVLLCATPSQSDTGVGME